MSGPKTLNAAIRASHERSPAAAASKRYRDRKSKGYVRTGPFDTLHELVWVMVDSGILPPEYVTQDGRHLRVEPGIMAEAWRSLQELLADREDEFLDFLKDNIQNKELPRRMDDTDFLMEIGLGRKGLAMRADSFLKAIEDHGFEVRPIKKSLSDQ